MDFSELKKLKSGTDIRGVATEGASNVTLTDETVTLIVKAFLKWLSLKYNKTVFTVAVGNDSRISADRIVRAARRAVLSSGCNFVYTGLSSTPSMFTVLKQPGWNLDASIMVTASHLPYDKNGLKFFTPGGGLDGADIDEILLIAAKQEFLSGNGAYFEKSFMDEYSAILVKFVEDACGKLPLAGKKIIVDAGNGAGGFFADKVLKKLGADTSGSQFLEPDGLFPNHIPNPEDRTAIDSLAAAVMAQKADLGIIFDTDVDRAACVDENGEEINRNALIALVSSILLRERAGVIVTDSVTSDHLTEFIESLGGKHLRFKRGYKNVIDKCRELNDSGVYSPLAIETSGHAAFKENYYLDDGAYLTVKLLISLALNAREGKSLSSLIEGLKRPLEEGEVRLGFNQNSVDYRDEGAKVIEDIKRIALSNADMQLAADNFEGVRISFDSDFGGGWLLVRMSVHEPVIPINFESDFAGGNAQKAKLLMNILEGYPFLNTENLKKFIT